MLCVRCDDARRASRRAESGGEGARAAREERTLIAPTISLRSTLPFDATNMLIDSITSRKTCDGARREVTMIQKKAFLMSLLCSPLLKSPRLASPLSHRTSLRLYLMLSGRQLTAPVTAEGTTT